MLLPPALLLASRSRQERVEAKGLATPAAPVECDAGGAPAGSENIVEHVGVVGILDTVMHMESQSNSPCLPPPLHMTPAPPAATNRKEM